MAADVIGMDDVPHKKDADQHDEQEPELLVGYSLEAAREIAAMTRDQYKMAERALLWKMSVHSL